MDGSFALTFLLLAPLDADGAEERHLCLSFDPPKCHKQPIWRILLNTTRPKISPVFSLSDHNTTCQPLQSTFLFPPALT